MKKENFLLAAIISLLLLACEKSKHPAPSPTNSTWIIDRDTFKGRAFYIQNASSKGLETYTDITVNGQLYGNFVHVIFDYTADKPATSATYTISNAPVVQPGSTECLIHAGITDCCDRWFSNTAGEKVTITVSPAGKLTATFSNITLSNGAGSRKSVSGTLIEQ